MGPELTAVQSRLVQRVVEDVLRAQDVVRQRQEEMTELARLVLGDAYRTDRQYRFTPGADGWTIEDTGVLGAQ